MSAWAISLRRPHSWGSVLGGNAPEDHGCGPLGGFQALAQTMRLRAKAGYSQAGGTLLVKRAYGRVLKVVASLGVSGGFRCGDISGSPTNGG
jgi:hypothetical protein